MADDSQSSSDEDFSYKDAGKKALEKAKKKIAAVNTSTQFSDIVDLTWISEYNDDIKPPNESLATGETTILSQRQTSGNNIVSGESRTRPKRKGARHIIVSDESWRPPKRMGVENSIVGEESQTRPTRNVMENSTVRRSKRLRSGRSKVAGSIAQSVTDITLDSTDDESVEDSMGLHRGISSTRIPSTHGNNVEWIDTICSDGRGGDAGSGQQAIAILGESSDVEILSPSAGAAVSNDTNELMAIKISWKLKPIEKFELRRHQKFKTIMEHFSKNEGVPLHKIVIFGGKNNCLIQPCDTPDTVGITITDVLMGGVLSEDGEGLTQRSRGLARQEERGQGDDGIRVRVQVEEGARSFPLMIGRQQKMRVLLIKVAEQLEVDVSKVRLSLDGEVIDYDMTPQKLDLEEDDVLDVLLS